MDTMGGGSDPAPPPTILAGRVSEVFSVFGCEGDGATFMYTQYTPLSYSKKV